MEVHSSKRDMCSKGFGKTSKGLVDSYHIGQSGSRGNTSSLSDNLKTRLGLSEKLKNSGETTKLFWCGCRGIIPGKTQILMYPQHIFKCFCYLPTERVECFGYPINW